MKPRGRATYDSAEFVMLTLASALVLILGTLVARALPAMERSKSRSKKPSASQPASAPIEQGKFTLHKFEQPIREETYENYSRRRFSFRPDEILNLPTVGARCAAQVNCCAPRGDLTPVAF